eukprot:TRINITY_DN4317_c0_g1_i1.p1 TRINITY_DN4317_c0_g1~~TRINITY_DN4317_c0_g1_i1.p1  ORF type:complete len:359 (+),score=72.00 TRINITY_DN4317_c0_g1_i1:80-1156(+)
MAEAEAAAELEHVRDALKRFWNMDARDIKLLDAGSTPNHAVTTADGVQYLCKALRSRLGAWVAENALHVTNVAAHASKNGLPTPPPVPSADGRLVVVEKGPGPDEETHFVVLEWAVGYQRADSHLLADPSLETVMLHNLGGLLAKLHKLPLPAFEVPRADAPGGHCLCDMGTYIEYASKPLDFFKGTESADADFFRSWCPKFAALFKDLPEPLVLIHGDCYLDNVLSKPAQPAPELLLIDWEDSCLTHPMADLGACAVGTCFVLSLGEDTADVKVELIRPRLAALIKGYNAERPINEAERKLLRPLMQACAWACGAFRYGRYLEGVTDLKTRKYGQLIEVVNILEGMIAEFDSVAFGA